MFQAGKENGETPCFRLWVEGKKKIKKALILSRQQWMHYTIIRWKIEGAEILHLLCNSLFNKGGPE